MGMRCISCGTDNNLSNRTVNYGQCKNCRHPFAFEPSTETNPAFKFTDKFFAKAIADISANDTLYFTPKQLFYLLDRNLKFKNFRSRFSVYIFFGIWVTVFFGTFLGIFGTFLGIGDLSLSYVIVWLIFNICYIINFFRASNSSELGYKIRQANARNLQILGGFILGVGILVSMVFKSFIIFAIIVILGMLSIYLGIRQRIRRTVKAETFLFNQNQFQDWITRWQQINPMSKMLDSPREEITSSSVNSDISAYSFDRAVICDSPAIAQLLIANNFHIENNCAVLSITGYPHSIFDTVMQMLSRNSELKVYALHDANPLGVSLVHQLRTNPNWFGNSDVRIYDLGLLPRQIFASSKVFIRASEESAQEAKQLPSDVRQSLSNDELQWLDAGNFVELESFSPRKILQVVTQGISRSQDVTASESLLLIDEGGYGGGGYVYAVESFG